MKCCGKMGARLSPALLFLAALFAANPASASLRLCNRTSYILYAAVAYAAKPDMVTQGWTWIAPGSCEEAISKPLKSPPYYLYARSSRAHSGPSRAWGGSTRLCVKFGNFAFRAPALGGCTEDDAFEASFSQIATKRKSDFTETLTEQPSISTLGQARIAGLQRLLSDTGFKISAIDGNDDKATQAALDDVPQEDEAFSQSRRRGSVHGTGENGQRHGRAGGLFGVQQHRRTVLGRHWPEVRQDLDFARLVESAAVHLCSRDHPTAFDRPRLSAGRPAGQDTTSVGA